MTTFSSDPTGPLLLCLALESPTSGMPLDGIDVNVWYLDDGFIVGHYHAVVAIFENIKKEGSSLGFLINES